MELDCLLYFNMRNERKLNCETSEILFMKKKY